VYNAAPVCSLTTLIFAPGIVPAVASFTLPVMALDPLWASATPVIATKVNKRTVIDPTTDLMFTPNEGVSGDASPRGQITKGGQLQQDRTIAKNQNTASEVRSQEKSALSLSGIG
jgi:hypothetical protein